MAASAIIVVAAIAYDQLVVDYGNDASYLLGKAAPAVVLVLTLATFLALGDFFVWLRRAERGTARLWWATAGVVAAFLIGWFAAKGWSLVWLVERDIEVTLDGDEFLPVVVGLWSACLAALVIRFNAKPLAVDQSAAGHEALTR
jgi:hypothetical protein